MEIQDAGKKIIYSEKVGAEKLLWAKEKKDINDDGIGKIDNTWYYCSYILDLKKEIKTDGKYNVMVTVAQGNKNVSLSNETAVEGQQYMFTLDRMEKEY